MTTLEGSIESIIFRNEDNGYTVFEILSVSGDGELSGVESRVTCTAYLTDVTMGENVRLTGNFVMHPSYGKQFGVASVARSAPTSVPGMIKYLASSIRGVGERTAKRITDVFGAETFDVMEKNPELLARVPGISMKRARDMGAAFAEQGGQRRVLMYLQQFGVSPLFASKIYKRYKDESIETVRRNPYLLAEDISGIGFKRADAIAKEVGFEPHSEFRIKAGLRYLLQEAAGSGHVYMEKGTICEEGVRLLGVDAEAIENALAGMQFERKIIQVNQDGVVAVYLNKYYYAESYVAKKLFEIRFSAPKLKGVEAAELEGFTLAERQKEAVTAAFECGLMVITGGPGTGKTTIINTLISLFAKRDMSVELAAPTGRAAKRMEEASGKEAKTIHRLLGISSGDDNADRVERDENNPIEADVVIIDESSMVDIMLMYYLCRAIKSGGRLILAGDADQLPSVGPGNVLKDIINSDEFSVVRLTEIFRQSAESAIVTNAHLINQGKQPVLNAKDKGFYFIVRDSIDSVQNALISLVRDRLPAYSAADPMTDIQVLTPMRKSNLGAERLNTLLQQALNPPGAGKNEREIGGHIFRVGDKVMQIKNNYNLEWRTADSSAGGVGVYNGDGGVITAIDESASVLRVCFDGGRLVDYDFNRIHELTPAYAVTIHKSQGSEYKIVVIPLLSGPPLLMTRNLLYTAITRAKDLAVIVGSPATLHAMVENNREVQRFSGLEYRVKRIQALAFLPPIHQVIPPTHRMAAVAEDE